MAFQNIVDDESLEVLSKVPPELRRWFNANNTPLPTKKGDFEFPIQGERAHTKAVRTFLKDSILTLVRGGKTKWVLETLPVRDAEGLPHWRMPGLWLIGQTLLLSDDPDSTREAKARLSDWVLGEAQQRKQHAEANNGAAVKIVHVRDKLGLVAWASCGGVGTADVMKRLEFKM